MNARHWAWLLLVALAGSTAVVVAEDTQRQPLAAEFLYAGKLVEGEQALRRHLLSHPKDDEARLGLVAVQLVSIYERITQASFRFGANSRAFPDLFGLPRGSGPAKVNPSPEAIRYVELRAMLGAIVELLTEADATLAQVKNPEVKLRLDLARIPLDLDGDGKRGELELASKLFTMPSQARIGAVEVAFDRGDVYWLRAHCHAVMGLCEFLLAHDWRESFERVGHVMFAKPVTPYEHLLKTELVSEGWHVYADIIALIHLVNWAVVEPERMKRALVHLETMAAQMRMCVDSLQAETDDDKEWVPAPMQRDAIDGRKGSKLVFAQWRENIDMVEGLLQGKKLLPQLRDLVLPPREPRDSRGINLRRVFLEPRRFDLVLWIQGSAALPYLEEGVVETKVGNWTILDKSLIPFPARSRPE